MKRSLIARRGLWAVVLAGLLLVLCLLVACTEPGPGRAETGATGTDGVSSADTAPESAVLDTKWETSEGFPTVPETQPETEPTTESASTSTTVPATLPVTEPIILPATDAVTRPVTEPETDPVTQPETRPEGWKPETGIFNEGIVVYEKMVETEIVAAFPDDDIGLPVKSGDEGVFTVFAADFEDGDVTVNQQAALNHQSGVQDGYLYVQYDASSENRFGGGWATWAPVLGAQLTTNKQSVLALKWDIYSREPHAWMTAFIGCYVSNYTGKIPDGPGDGLWFSFNEQSNKMTVYHPDVKTWAAGLVDLPLEEGLLNGEIGTQVVCLPDRTTCIYITPAGETAAQLVCTVRFEDGKMRIYNGGDEMVKETDSTTNALKGENFSIFGHGGGAKIDDVAILGCSKGEIIERTTVTATPTEGNSLGLDITDKTDLVSICYSVWFDAILGSGTEPVEYWHNITESLAGNQPWGGVHAFHYWAKPALGYYRSSDKAVIRTHMTQLYTAGVDFIIIDFTNQHDGYIGTGNWNSFVQTPMDAICDTIMEMRAEGLGTPYVVFWAGNGNNQGKGPFFQALYDRYCSSERWKDCFVFWDGKPFLLTTQIAPDDFPLPELFTVRHMWGLGGVRYDQGQWSFLSTNSYGKFTPGPDGKPEQVSVAVAAQESYMSQPSAHGRQGGVFWFKQWYNAFEVRPKIVTLTWWNEWTAQRFEISGLDGPQFVDNYNQNYSRDIEPMEGGHGDRYYQWLIQYISAYKAGQDCPILVNESVMPVVNRWLKKPN